MKELVLYVLIWDVIYTSLFAINYLVNPEIFISGSKAFVFIDTHPFFSLALTSLIASVIWLFDTILFYRYLRKFSTGSIVLYNLTMVVVIIVWYIIIVGIFHYWADDFFKDGNWMTQLAGFLFDRLTLYFILMSIAVATFMAMGRIIYEKVGSEKFLSIIWGYYKRPREEERIFIFIDLISSTHYAEKLGHKKYSQFIQECFKDIGKLEMRYEASQYQFIGDEVVLSWPANRNRHYKNAVDFFFAFENQLKNKEAFFKTEFDIVPKFTGSINSGLVMMAELGDIKSEIAFHGDVLNTAARIQKYCKHYLSNVLATEAFVKGLKKTNTPYELNNLGHVDLKGKKDKVCIYDINILNNNANQTNT
jgi:adenylate cyclase